MTRNTLIMLLSLITNITFSQTDFRSSQYLITLLEADNIKSENEIRFYDSLYNKILSHSRNELENESDIYEKHKLLFELLHNDHLKKYKDEAYIARLFKHKEFNCVTAVILYQMLCADLGLSIKLYETPFHVYITADIPGKKNIKIELTDPVDGFDMKQDISDYIEYLIDYKLITKEELLEKGSAAIYNETITDTRVIKPIDLIAIYYANLAYYCYYEGRTFDAYRFIKKSVSVSPDSARIESHNSFFLIYAKSMENNADSLTSFLVEYLDTIPDSKEFHTTMIAAAKFCIHTNLSSNDFEKAEKIFDKLCGVLPDSLLTDSEIRKLDVGINSEIIRSMTIRGEYESAFNLAGNLFHRNKKNERALDTYLAAGGMYMQTLGISDETEKLLDVADSMFSNAPQIKSVEDVYVNACISNVMKTGLYKTDSGKSKKILTDALSRLPGNKGIINALTYLYHEMAMAEIRNRKYQKALDMLNEGLTYDPDNWELKHELELTKDLLKKK